MALEVAIFFFAMNLISIDMKIGVIIASQLSFSRLCDLFSCFFQETVSDENAHSELNNILKRAAEAEEKRNAILHSAWAVVGTKSPWARIKIGIEEDYELEKED
jgi:hypothetical protein